MFVFSCIKVRFAPKGLRNGLEPPTGLNIMIIFIIQEQYKVSNKKILLKGSRFYKEIWDNKK